MKNFFATLVNIRLVTIFLLGFSSGLPLALTSSTLQTWYTVAGINIIAIGCLSLVGQPYIYKFFWAPLMDRYTPPFLGRRRGWMLITQCALVITLSAMAFINPAQTPFLLAAVAVLVAFFSASQDINIDAYRADILEPQERGLGSAMSVGGYRIGMLVSAGLALVIADLWGWKICYLIMAGFMSLGLLTTLFAPEIPDPVRAPTNLWSAVVDPFREFMSRPYALAILLFIILYKISFEFSLVLTPSFLYRHLGFSLMDIGTINKGVGLTATLVGVFVGGVLLTRMNLFFSLWIFGFLHALTNLGYMVLALMGKNYFMMMIAVTLENLFAGMETAAFVALLMSLCDHRYTATQFALFSALAALSRVFSGPLAGLMVSQMGWAHFYLWAFLVALPGLLLLYFLRNTMIVSPQKSDRTETVVA